MLNYSEFWELIQSKMNLNLTEDEIALIQSEADYDVDSEVSWTEFVQLIPKLLCRIAEKSGQPSIHDWCELVNEQGGRYYYNKRTSESRWDAPEGWSESQSKKTLKAMPPDLTDYLSNAFSVADKDQSGVLTDCFCHNLAS